VDPIEQPIPEHICRLHADDERDGRDWQIAEVASLSVVRMIIDPVACASAAIRRMSRGAKRW